VSAGQIWQRPNGLRWVEVQAAAVEPSGWRLMIPLVPIDDADGVRQRPADPPDVAGRQLAAVAIAAFQSGLQPREVALRVQGPA
jgi:hypothetical protein